jgi:hypothetical protein
MDSRTRPVDAAQHHPLDDDLLNLSKTCFARALHHAAVSDPDSAVALKEFSCAVRARDGPPPSGPHAGASVETSAADAVNTVLNSALVKRLLQKVVAMVKGQLTLTYEQDLMNDLNGYVHRRTGTVASLPPHTAALDLFAAGDEWQEELVAFFTMYPQLLTARIRLKLRALLDSADFESTLDRWVAAVVGGVPLAGPAMTLAITQVLAEGARQAIEAAFNELLSHTNGQTVRSWFLIPAIDYTRSYVPAVPAALSQEVSPSVGLGH